MTDEFKVWFKGFGPDNDVWLPASSFNQTVSAQTTSCFGRKKKTQNRWQWFILNGTKRRKATKLLKKVTQELWGSHGKKDERGKETWRTGQEMQSKQKKETLVSRHFSTKENALRENLFDRVVPRYPRKSFCSKQPSTKNKWKELPLCPAMTVTLMLLTHFMRCQELYS